MQHHAVHRLEPRNEPPAERRLVLSDHAEPALERRPPPSPRLRPAEPQPQARQVLHRRQLCGSSFEARFFEDGRERKDANGAAGLTCPAMVSKGSVPISHRESS